MYKYYSKKTKLFLVLCLIFFSIQNLIAEEYKIGGKNGWKDVPFRDGIVEGQGRFGHTCLELATNSFEVDSYTDLLIDFEENRTKDLTGNYTVEENHLYLTDKAIMGKKAGMSRNRGNGLVLSGNENSIFGRDGIVSSFSIDFWICPTSMENGEVLLNWRSSLNVQDSVVYQLINISIYKNKLKFVLSNIFNGYTKNNGDVELYGFDNLIPNKWSHHTLSYNEENGIIEYRVNGVLEDIKYMTTTGKESGSIYPAVIGVKAKLEICPNYSGFIDDVRINRCDSNSNMNKIAEDAGFLHRSVYKVSGGRFESVPILTKAGSVLNSVTAEMYVPAQTAIQLYVRSGDNSFNWTESYPEWIPINVGEKLTDVTGLYFQVAAELYPDGNGTTTPTITDITLNYTALPDPLPPFRITAEKGNGCVSLNWSYSVDETAGGYYVYYGTRPGEYLGRVAIEGDSPINVGNTTSFTINGLKNGTIYYFAVAAWSKYDNRIVGPLSKEVYARPSVK